MIAVLELMILFAGYIVGLGAVTVIDIHGFLGRNSEYWTSATITAHKITKPLIWVGTISVLIGSVLVYTRYGVSWISYLHWLIFALLIPNGCFLTFWLSPKLIARERQGRSQELLPSSWQKAITASFLVSVTGWWGSLALFTYYLIMHIKI